MSGNPYFDEWYACNPVRFAAFDQAYTDILNKRYPAMHSFVTPRGERYWIGDQTAAGIHPLRGHIPKDEHDAFLADTLQNLRDNRIRGIICCTGEARSAFDYKGTDEGTDIKYLYVPIDDRPDGKALAPDGTETGPRYKDVFVDMLGHVMRFIGEIHKEQGEVLIHCNAGASRSVTVALAIHILEGQKLMDAFAYIQSIRPGVRPSLGTWLVELEYKLDTPELMPKLIEKLNKNVGTPPHQPVKDAPAAAGGGAAAQAAVDIPDQSQAPQDGADAVGAAAAMAGGDTANVQELAADDSLGRIPRSLTSGVSTVGQDDTVPAAFIPDIRRVQSASVQRPYQAEPHIVLRARDGSESNMGLRRQNADVAHLMLNWPTPASAEGPALTWVPHQP